MSTPTRSYVTSIFFSSVLAAIVVTSICTILYQREANTIAANTLDLETRRMDRFTTLYAHDINEAISALRLLATGDGFSDYLSSGRLADLQRATHRAVYFSTDNPDFDKVRYIDETGMEVIRVDHQGEIIPPAQLQSKADRPFFQKTNALQPGEVFVSTIDLNFEHGQIEQPYKPTVRVGMPVFDQNGHRRGIYIINILAGNLINRLINFVPRYSDRFRMLDSSGNWLGGVPADQQWGSVLPGRAGFSLAKTNPELWEKIKAQPAGQVYTEGGYFTWSRAVPSTFYSDKPLKVVAEDDYLVLGSQVSAGVWQAQFVRLRQTFVVVTLMVVTLALGIVWVYQANRRAQIERDRFFSLTRDMLCVCGFDGYFKRVNPAWRASLGYSSEEMLMKPFIDFVHPDDKEKTITQMADLAKGREVFGFENRYQCKDGSYRWLTWSARPLVDEQLIYGSARDMTERKLMEEKLQLSEQRLRLMVESAKDHAIFMLDPSGCVVSWNAGAQRLKGYTSEEIIGRHISIFYPDERKAQEHANRELIEAAEKGRFEEEDWRMRKDGTRFWANVTLNAMRNREGELIGFVKITRDVTARRESEDAIKRLNEELKERADLLQSANKELESFSYSVSHDLRAPLRHINGFVEMLQRNPAFEQDAGAQRQMAVIARAAKEMGRLIDDLLAFSRTSRAEMHPVSIDMNAMVALVIRESESDIAGREIAWDLRKLSPTAGDPALLRLVWMNLIGNAIKYTRPAAETRIEIGEKPSEEKDERVYYIRDNGVGFDMQYAGKLFGVFQRLHRAEDFEGTGIGLANVQRIILRHGGRVWAESKPNEGSTFFFTLPVTPNPQNG